MTRTARAAPDYAGRAAKARSGAPVPCTSFSGNAQTSQPPSAIRARFRRHLQHADPGVEQDVVHRFRQVDRFVQPDQIRNHHRGAPFRQPGRTGGGDERAVASEIGARPVVLGMAGPDHRAQPRPQRFAGAVEHGLQILRADPFERRLVRHVEDDGRIHHSGQSEVIDGRTMLVANGTVRRSASLHAR